METLFELAADSEINHPDELDFERTVEIRRTPLIRSLLRPEMGFPETLKLEVHSDDEMLGYMSTICGGDPDRGLAQYFYTGRQAFSMTEQLVNWCFGGFDQIKMLDFASGYGRVTRHILSRMDGCRLTVADLMAEAVDFQRQAFRVNGFGSTVDPESLHIPETYDVVQAISLFTHLPKDLFERWLVKLWQHVRHGGMLIFSVHSISLLNQTPAKAGFLFAEVSENQQLDAATYGSAWVDHSFMKRALKRLLGDGSFLYLPRGLCGYQDVYVAVKERRASFRSLDYQYGAKGHIDSVEYQGENRLALRGWALPIQRGQVVQGVDFLLNDQVIAGTRELGPRPDVAEHFADRRLSQCGWNLEVELPASVSFSQDAVMVIIRCGTDTVLSMGCIYSMLADSAQAQVEHLMSHGGGAS